MTKDEAEEIISIEFNPIRCGFHGSDPVWVRDVLNLGVSPVTAIQLVRSHVTYTPLDAHQNLNELARWVVLVRLGPAVARHLHTQADMFVASGQGTVRGSRRQGV